MAIKRLKLPLFNNSTYYSYSVALEGNRYTLDFLFLERLGQWVVTLKASDGTVLIRNQRLTSETLLFNDYKLPNLTGAFYFKPIAQTVYNNETASLLQPKDFYELFYIFDDGE